MWFHCDCARIYIANSGRGVALIYGVSRLSKVGSREPSLPPGPPTLPVFGNLTELPLKEAHLKFTEWARIYGGVYSLKVGPQTMIVVSSVEAIHEILEKNGALTASRPQIEALRRFTRPSGMVSFSPYGRQWRKMRKAAAEMMKPGARLQQLPIKTAEVTRLLFDVQETPQDLFYHIQRAVIPSVFSIVGGVRIPQVNTELLKRFFHLWEMISEICEAGNTPPVDLIPILAYIPYMFVGCWKARCVTIDRTMQSILWDLLRNAEKRLAEERGNSCYIEIMIQNAKEWDLNKDDITGVTSGLVVAGVSTTTSFLQTVFLLATAHPECQKVVQAEMDRVVGADRAPTLDDMPNLPHLNAFIREAHRFRPIAPLGVPHQAIEDQFYQDKLIPKGCTIFQNNWALFHDPDLYDQPDVFDPSRFIRSPYGTKEGVEKSIGEEALRRLETYPFGAGRRRCVGMPIAIEASALVAANLFWAFEFCHFVDDNGNRIESDLWAFSTGLTYDPLPYKCKIKTRSKKQEELLTQNYLNSTPIFQQFEEDLSDEDRIFVENVRTRLQA